MSFFFYRQRLGKWWPTIATDQPYKLTAEDKAAMYPFTDDGLGWKLEGADRSLTLEELKAKFPPPEEPVIDDDPPFDFKDDIEDAEVVEDTRTAPDFVREYIKKIETENAELKRENAGLIETVTRLENGAPTDD